MVTCKKCGQTVKKGYKYIDLAKGREYYCNPCAELMADNYEPLGLALLNIG